MKRHRKQIGSVGEKKTRFKEMKGGKEQRVERQEGLPKARSISCCGEEDVGKEDTRSQLVLALQVTDAEQRSQERTCPRPPSWL